MQTLTLTLEARQLAAIASLAEFANQKDSITPILGAVNLTVDPAGLGDTVTAVTTDRYRIARWRGRLVAPALQAYTDTEPTEPATEPFTLTLPVAFVSQAVKTLDRHTPSHALATFTIAREEPTATAHAVTLALPSGASFVTAEMSGNFPHVGRLMPTDPTARHGFPDMIAFNAAMFGGLAKLRAASDYRVPASRIDGSWRLTIATDLATPESLKRAPIYCRPSDSERGDGITGLDAMIQPNLILS